MMPIEVSPGDLLPGAQLQPVVLPQDPTTILVVDDDKDLVEALQRRLNQHGFQVRSAHSGADGRSLAAQLHPDLSLLDVRLPDANGLDLCQELTDAPNTCGIPVILLGGCDHSDVIQRSRAAGCEYFLRKPYDPNALLTLIQHALQESRSWPEASEDT